MFHVIRKWRTDNNRLRKYVYNSDTIIKDKNIAKHNEKALGIEGNEFTNSFIFNVNEVFKNVRELRPTSRSALNIFSLIYDPIGYLQPLTVKLKIISRKFIYPDVTLFTILISY